MTISSVKAKKKTLPVSRKAYESFIERMRMTFCVLLNRDELFDEAVNLIDSYLETHVFTAAGQSVEVAIAFSILIPEIDKACARSASARLRAAKRKKDNSSSISTETESALPSISPSPSVQPHIEPPTIPNQNHTITNRKQRREAYRKHMRELRREARIKKRAAT
ncbi:MAG: hypothetical protein K2J65_00925 [Duncaniella sp.]|nr:hypothetical protein [Duncaniella sp.]